MKSKEPPFPPGWAGSGLEAHFMAMPPGAPKPFLLQVRVAMRPFVPGSTYQEGATSHTEWFALTPDLARQLAATLQDAADRAERPLPPEPRGIQ